MTTSSEAFANLLMTSIKLDSNIPFWESSSRPLHPKCVWIESMSGTSNRHFIFDYRLSNTYRHRNDVHVLPSTEHLMNLQKLQPNDRIEDRINRLTIVGSADNLQSEHSLSSLSDTIDNNNHFPINKSIETEESFQNDLDVMDQNEIPNKLSITQNAHRINSEIDRNNNLLAERVLQWLDLAGGINHLSASSTQHGTILNVTKRRSLTAKESRKPIQVQTDLVDKSKTRRELLHQLSMTFNESEINEVSTPCKTIVPLNFGDLFPTTYRCSRKFISLRKPKNAADSLTPHKNLSIRNKTKCLNYFEDQYRSMIHRQILEKSCNTQAAKRQLHIFMPNLPKRCVILNETNQISHIASAKSVKSADSQN